MEQVFLSIAGNIDPETHLVCALERLAERVQVVAISPFYRTPAIGQPDQPLYLNGVVLVETPLEARALKYEVLRSIESELGRVRMEDKYAAREIDLDILLYGAQVIAEEGLELPDPDLLERIFLAAGVLAIEPSLVLPDTGERLADVIDSEALAALEVDEDFTKQIQEYF